jgi:hypothetical protein
MKVIIDSKNPITVLDENGTVLFDYQPDQFEDSLRDLGFSEGEIEEINSIMGTETE